MILFDFGGKIKGDSTKGGHDKWVQVDGAWLGLERAMIASSGGSDRDTDSPNFSEVRLTKPSDVSSVDLFVEAAGGTDPKKAAIHFCNESDSDKVDVYMSWELENALITSYSVSTEEGKHATETITLNFTKIKIAYTRFKPDGKQEKISPKGWNLETDSQL